MLNTLETSSKVFMGIAHTNQWLPLVGTIISQPRQSVNNPELLENILKGCQNCREWLASIEEYINLLQQERILHENDKSSSGLFDNQETQFS